MITDTTQISPKERTWQQEAEVRAIAEVTANFRKYAVVNLRIQTKESELIPLSLNNVQEMLEEIWQDIEDAGLLIRLYILKARQFGVSTWLTGRYFWRTATDFNRRSMIVTHEPKATGELFAMQKRYLANLQPEYKPAVLYNNQGRIVFNTPDGKEGLDSSILVGTANVDNLGSGMTIMDLHLSESAKYPASCQKDLETSLLQAVPKLKGTAVIHESTANGMGGEFYIGFNACRIRYEMYLDGPDRIPKWKKSINLLADENNNYASIFIPAFVFLKYRMEVPKGFVRTKHEEELVAAYNCPDEYLQWRRDTLANECKGDINKYHQEYPHTSDESFVSSGTPAFNPEIVIAARKKAEMFKPISRYECQIETGNFMMSPDGRVRVWEEPIPGNPYLCSGDVAEGLIHGDFDSATIWNHRTGLEAANFHGHMDPWDYAAFLNWFGRRYNLAWMVIERNNHGKGVIDRLLHEFKYPHMYVEKIPDPPHKIRKRFGFQTSGTANGGGMRPLIIDNLKQAVHTGKHGIRDPEKFSEMLNFRRQDNGKEEANSGTFDDRTMDCAIGKWTLKMLPPVPTTRPSSGPSLVSTQKTLGSTTGRTRTKPDPNAWG